MQDAQDCKIMLAETLSILEVLTSASARSHAQLSLVLNSGQQLLQLEAKAALARVHVAASNTHSPAARASDATQACAPVQLAEPVSQVPANDAAEAEVAQVAAALNCKQQLSQQLAALDDANKQFEQHKQSCKQMLRSLQRMTQSLALRCQADEAAGSAIRAAAMLAQSQHRAAAARTAARDMAAHAEHLRLLGQNAEADLAAAQAGELQHEADTADQLVLRHAQAAKSFSNKADRKLAHEDTVAAEAQVHLPDCNAFGISQRTGGANGANSSTTAARSSLEATQAPSCTAASVRADALSDGAAMVKRSFGLLEVSLAALVTCM